MQEWWSYTSILLYLFMAWCLIKYVHGQLYLNLSMNVLKPTRYEPLGTEKCSEQNGNVFSLAKTRSCAENYAVFHNEVRDVW
jgi:hypothetical protein